MSNGDQVNRIAARALKRGKGIDFNCHFAAPQAHSLRSGRKGPLASPQAQRDVARRQRPRGFNGDPNLKGQLVC